VLYIKHMKHEDCRQVML